MNGPGGALGTLLVFFIIVGIGQLIDKIRSSIGVDERLENNSYENYIIPGREIKDGKIKTIDWGEAFISGK